MRIIFTGGGTGGHFYPVIAVAEALRDICDREKITQRSLYFFSDKPIEQALLDENELQFVEIPAGKLRLSPSFKNITDLFRTLHGIFRALVKMYKIYPDVVFAKGGYSSFPTLVAAWLMGIPIIIHESDMTAGRVNKIAGRFAKRIATAFPETVAEFPAEKTACVGLPMRKTILPPAGEIPQGIPIQPELPIVLVVGGSQGSETINIALLEALPEILKIAQVVHQTGEKNIDFAKREMPLVVTDANLRTRYMPYAHLPGEALKAVGTRALTVVSRAGSMLFEIGAWGVPSILIPITHSHGDHQRKNAFSFARAGGCDVIEEANLTPHILAAEIIRMQTDVDRRTKMAAAAKVFSKTTAAAVIADEMFKIAYAHEE